MRGIPFVAWVMVAAACSSSSTNQAPGGGGSGAVGGSATGGASGSGGAGGVGGQGGGGVAGSGGASGGSGGAAGAGGDASLGGAAGTAGGDASLGGSAGTGGASGSGGAGATGGTGGAGATGGTGGTSATGGAGGGDASVDGSAGDASTDAASGGSTADAGGDASSDAPSDASNTDASDSAIDAPPADAGACPLGATGGDGTAHYPLWKIAGDARPDSEFTTSLSTNVALDHTTCLMWERSAATGGSDWTTADSNCAASTVDGYSDWRLPTRAELISLTDFTRIYPALNPTVFPGVSNATAIGARFWSSTLLAGSTKRWVVVHGGIGQMSYIDTSSADLAAYRCVRGTGAPSGPRFDSSTNGVVKDNETSLTWEAAPTNQVYTQATATSYCAGLGLLGGGWRLPTIRELATLPDPTLTSPALPPAFTSVSTWYWSGTVGYQTSQNWAVLIGAGFSQPQAYTNERVRCVR
ncbi:MAG: DUF1566 domain-containing protein [Myxococcales bacterium]|nr:DUF1566 domain-containing protein [Myxococcales bacterium]